MVDVHLNSVEDIQSRIQENLRVLANFKNNRDQQKSRQEYLDELKNDLCKYHEYNEDLMEYIINLFGPAEYLEESEKPRPLVIRTNTLKTKRRELAQNLIQKGVNLDPLAD